MNLQEIVNRIEVLIRAIIGEIMPTISTLVSQFSGKHSDLTDIQGTYTHEQIDAKLDESETDPVFQNWMNTNPLAQFLKSESDPIFNQWLASNPFGNFVVGPASSTVRTIPIYDNATGKLIGVTNVIIDEQGQMFIEPTPDENGFCLGLSVYARGSEAYGLVGMANKFPVVGCSLDLAPTGHRTGMAMRGDSAHTVIQNGYALDFVALMPLSYFTDPRASEHPGGKLSFVLTDKTIDVENVDAEIWVLRNGVMTKVVRFDPSGNMYIDGQVNSPTMDLFIKKDGSVAYEGSQSMGGNKLTALAEPTNPNDAARLIDVQNAAVGFNPRDVLVATTENITLANLQTIDGTLLVATNRVLVKNQTLPEENGIYLAVDGGAWTRAADPITPGMFVQIQQGTTNINTAWTLSVDGTITIGVTPLNFIQFFAMGQTTAGAGLVKVGNQMDSKVAAGRLVINAANEHDLATTAVTAGAYGNSQTLAVPYFTVDIYGRLTQAGEKVITIPNQQIQSDWNQVNPEILDFIKNKPIIPEAQIQADWNQQNSALKDYIKNKPTVLFGTELQASIPLIDPIEFEFRDLKPGTIQIWDLDIDGSFNYIIDSLVLETDAGTLTGVAVKIGATAITGLDAVTVDTTKDKTLSAGANSVVSGDRITLVTSVGYTGTPTLIKGKINRTRNIAVTINSMAPVSAPITLTQNQDTVYPDPAIVPGGLVKEPMYVTVLDANGDELAKRTSTSAPWFVTIYGTTNPTQTGKIKILY